MKKSAIFYDQDIHNLATLEEVYSRLLPLLKEKCVLLLIGPAGAGKTTSVQLLTKLLGIADVASPSFGIHHHYENNSGRAMDHVDLYRLGDEDDLESTGFWDLFSQPKALVAIEWADRLEESMLPIHWQRVRISLTPLAAPEARHLKIEILS